MHFPNAVRTPPHPRVGMVRSQRLMLGLLVGLIPGIGVQAQLLYSESFPGVAGNTSRTELTTVGWNVHGRDAELATAGAAPRASIRGQLGTDLVRGYVHAEYAGTGTNVNAQLNRTTLIWTNQVASLALLPSAIGSVTWMQGNGNVQGQYRVAVQIGGQWYVSQPAGAQALAATNANFRDNATQMEFDFSAASWFDLAFDGSYGVSGTVLSLDPLTPAVLPGGLVQAIGLYIGGTGGGTSSLVTGARRIDDFMIFGVPIGGGGAGSAAATAAVSTNRATRVAQQQFRAHQARVARDQRLQQHRRNQQR